MPMQMAGPGVARTVMKIMVIGLLVEALAFPLPAASGEDFRYANQAGREGGLLLLSAAAFGFGWHQDRDFRPLIPEEIDALDSRTLNSLDRAATRFWSPGADQASDHLVHTQMILPLGLGLAGHGSSQPGKVLPMYLETMAVTSGVTYLLKSVFGRTRPFVYNRNPAISADLKMSRTARRSFPSGHAANAFASMVFFAGVYEKLNPGASDTGLVWAGCLTSAAVTGVLRVKAGRHFTSDVLAGAALGALVGYLVPSWHEVDPESQGGQEGKQFGVSYGFSF